MTDLDPYEEQVRAERDARAAEYGQFVATVPIDIGGARAFNPGDPVPASHVDREVVTLEQVAKVTPERAAKPKTTESKTTESKG